MLDSPEQTEAMFPKLDGGQIARLEALGRQQNAPALQIILERGDSRHGIFVVLSGSIEVIRVSSGGETVLHVLGRGEFTGDVNLLHLPWAHTSQLQQLRPFLLTTNVSKKSGNLLFAQR
jgi:CRP-like cAMP-binding protein